MCFNILTLFSHSARTPLSETVHTQEHLSQEMFSPCANTLHRNCSHSAGTLCSGTVLTVREHLVHCENTSLQCKSVRTRVSGALIHITQWHLYQAIRQQHHSMHIQYIMCTILHDLELYQTGVCILYTLRYLSMSTRR